MKLYLVQIWDDNDSHWGRRKSAAFPTIRQAADHVLKSKGHLSALDKERLRNLLEGRAEPLPLRGNSQWTLEEAELAA